MKLELNDIRMDSESGIQIGEVRKGSLDIETLEQGPQTHTIVAAGFVGLTALGSGASIRRPHRRRVSYPETKASNLSGNRLSFQFSEG